MSEYVNVRISREAYDAIKDGITQAACDIYNKIGIWPSNPEILHVSEHINRIVINHAHNWKELFDAMRETNAEYEDVPKELLDTIM